MDEELEYRNWLMSCDESELKDEQLIDKEMILTEQNRDKIRFQFDFGDRCGCQKGTVVEKFFTGCKDADAVSEVYECGGIYNNNFGDRVGDRSFSCFWDCSRCKKSKLPRIIEIPMTFDTKLFVEMLEKAEKDDVYIDEYVNKLLSEHHSRKLNDKDIDCLYCNDCECENYSESISHLHCSDVQEMADAWYSEHPDEPFPDL